MTTIVNTPSPTSDSGGGFAFLLGAIFLVGCIVALVSFGVPALKRMNPVEVTVESPEINVPTPQVNVQAPQVPSAPPAAVVVPSALPTPSVQPVLELPEETSSPN